MKIQINWKKGVNIAVLAISIFYLSGFGVLIAPTEAQAGPSGTKVNWVKVNDMGAVHVAPNTSIEVKVNVTTAGSGSSDNWKSTKYKIEGQSWKCVNTPNHHNDGTYTEKFSITSPGATGKYDLDVIAYQGDNCTGGNDSKTLPNAIFVKAPDTKIEAQKVICDAEEYLPNGQVANPITASTASDWVAQSKGHCWLAKDWDFKWWTGDTSPTTFSVNSPAVIPTDEGTVKVREVLPEGYIGFSNDNNDNYSAEFYCGNDVKGYDNEEWLSRVESGATYQCVAFNVKEAFCGDGILQPEIGEQCESGDTQSCTTQEGYAGEQSCFMGNKSLNQSDQQPWCTWNESCEKTEFCGDKITNGPEQCDGGENCTDQCTLKPAVIDAYKIICPAETTLPDWGVVNSAKPADTPTSITDWVRSGKIFSWVKDNGCEFARDWDFEWAYDPAKNPGDNNDNNTNANWHTFNTTSPAELTDMGNGKVWVRETVDHNYIPFSSAINTSEKQNSAEMYCHTDILNYDNYEWISGLTHGKTYNCVAFNVLDQGTVTFKKDVLWNNPDKNIDDTTAFGVKVSGNHLGDVAEGSPLTLKLRSGDYKASEILPAGYEVVSGEGDFTVTTGSEQTIKLVNKTTCTPGEGWAYSVVSANQGTTKNGSPVAGNRSDPMDAVGPADTIEPQLGNFYSLGKGGSLTLAFEGTVKDVEGVDLSFHEDTWGNRNNYPEESAMVEVSYDGNAWFEIGSVSSQPESSDGIHYLDIGGVLPVIKYVRLTDTTNFDPHNGSADGYDLDAVDVTYGYCEDVAPSYIQGKKFNDFNYDGKRDKGDVFMDGWTINLYDSTWTLVDSMETGDDSTEAGNVKEGQYRFTNLYPDTYYICEVQQDGWYQTRPADKFDNLSGNPDEAPYCFKATITDNGQKRTGRQFGNAELLSLHGYKWHDVNGNGIRDCAAEPEKLGEFQTAFVEELPEPTQCEEYSEDLLGDWTINLYEGRSLEPMATTTTANEGDHFGWYWFEDLKPGSYRICEELQEGWSQTYPEESCHFITIPNEVKQTENGVLAPEYHFGNRTQATLEIEKTVLVNSEVSSTALEGDTLSYTITVTNNGDETDYGLYVEDTTPTNSTIVTNSGDLASAVFNGDTFRWGPFDLAGNSSKTFTFDVTVNAGLPVGETLIENQASLWRMEAEDNQVPEVGFLHKLFGINVAYAADPTLLLVASSNLVVTSVTVEEPTIPDEPREGIVAGDTTNPVLTIEKSSNVEFTTMGETVEYTVVITNSGDGQALNMVMEDTLPAGFTFDDGSSKKTWNLGALAVGTSKSVAYDVTVGQDLEAGMYINTATVSANNHDPISTTHEVELRIPKVLGATVPNTGASMKDYIVFVISILLIGLGTYLFNREKFVKVK